MNILLLVAGPNHLLFDVFTTSFGFTLKQKSVVVYQPLLDIVPYYCIIRRCNFAVLVVYLLSIYLFE